MGRLDDRFRERIVEIVSRHTGTRTDNEVTENPSSAGNFISVTVTITAISRDQLDSIYQDLTENPAVLMAL